MKPPETVYRGERLTGPAGEEFAARVTVVDRSGVVHPLSPRRSLKIREHSPTGFEWGYGGSGPLQLALALLLDVTEDPDLAQRCYHWFMWATVACWGPSWSVTASELFAWVDRWQREQRQLEDLEAGIKPFMVEEPTSNLVAAKGGAA